MRHVADLCAERGGIRPAPSSSKWEATPETNSRHFRTTALRVLGVDPARDLAAVATGRGVSTLPEFFSRPRRHAHREEHGPARLVLGRHVFAHIHDIADLRPGCRRLLRLTGCWPSRCRTAGHAGAQPVRHRSTTSTCRTSRRHPGAFCSPARSSRGRRRARCRCTAARSSSSSAPGRPLARPRPCVDRMLEKERRPASTEDAHTASFADRPGQETRAALTSGPRARAAEGRRVAGYGAPAKGNTLLTACGLGHEQFEFCRTPPTQAGQAAAGHPYPGRSPSYRQGTPAGLLPVAGLELRRGDLPQGAGYLEAGGRFIVPIPGPGS